MQRVVQPPSPNVLVPIENHSFHPVRNIRPEDHKVAQLRPPLQQGAAVKVQPLTPLRVNETQPSRQPHIRPEDHKVAQLRPALQETAVKVQPLTPLKVTETQPSPQPHIRSENHKVAQLRPTLQQETAAKAQPLTPLRVTERQPSAQSHIRPLHAISPPASPSPSARVADVTPGQAVPLPAPVQVVPPRRMNTVSCQEYQEFNKAYDAWLAPTRFPDAFCLNSFIGGIAGGAIGIAGTKLLGLTGFWPIAIPGLFGFSFGAYIRELQLFSYIEQFTEKDYNEHANVTLADSFRVVSQAFDLFVRDFPKVARESRRKYMNDLCTVHPNLEPRVLEVIKHMLSHAKKYATVRTESDDEFDRPSPPSKLARFFSKLTVSLPTLKDDGIYRREPGSEW